MTSITPEYWKTKEGAAFNAIGALCDPDASISERIEAADILREAIGMPVKHKPECGINTTESDEPDASDCDCGYWDEPKAPTVSEAFIGAGLNAAIDLAHATANDAGWYRDPQTGAPIKRNFGEVIALMHSELSEALEADRKGLMDDKLPHRSGVEVELADCVIRIFDTARALGLDLAAALIEKNRFNRARADHKLENRAAAGGKRY